MNRRIGLVSVLPLVIECYWSGTCVCKPAGFACPLDVSKEVTLMNSKKWEALHAAGTAAAPAGHKRRGRLKGSREAYSASRWDSNRGWPFILIDRISRDGLLQTTKYARTKLADTGQSNSKGCTTLLR